MRVKKIRLSGYRNYGSLMLDLDDNINILIGNNAQGKTNILESVCYAASGSSFRTNNDADLIMWDEPGGRISLEFQRRGVDQQLEFVFSRDKKRQIIYNGSKIQPKNLMGIINVVLFSPEDLFLIKGAPAGRRKFLDNEISQASPAYYNELSKYNRILLQRNTLLKKIRDGKANISMLDMWDVQLIDSGIKIIRKRLEAVKKLNMLANLMQRRISGNEENLTLQYEIKGEGIQSSDVAENLEIWYNKTLNELTEKDIFRGSTGIGPHRDDIGIFVNSIDLKAFGSQGQQRTGVLSMKLSELEFIRSENGEYPILLLDDVMSELDSTRRKHLLNFIQRENIQTIITATDKAYFPQEAAGRCFHVDNGKVKQGY